MKRILKLSSILLLLIVACCPFIFLTGCESSDVQDPTKLEWTGDWTFTKGQPFSKGQGPTSITGTIYSLKYEDGEWKYVEGETYTKFSDMVEAGVISGVVDTSSTTTGKQGTVSFGGKVYTITYMVTD